MDAINLVCAGINATVALFCFAAAVWADSNKMFNLFLAFVNVGLAVMNLHFGGALG